MGVETTRTAGAVPQGLGAATWSSGVPPLWTEEGGRLVGVALQDPPANRRFLDRLAAEVGAVRRMSALPDEAPVLALFRGNDAESRAALAAVGLSERRLLQRTIGEMGWSQKVKLLLAQCIYEGVRTALVEEEIDGALAPELLKVFGLHLNKLSRKHGLHIVVPVLSAATLDDALHADVIVEPLAGGALRARALQHEADAYEAIYRDVRFTRITMDDYRTLAAYHYAGVPPVTPDHLYGAYYSGKLAAAMMYTSPVRELGSEVIEADPVLSFISASFYCRNRTTVAPEFRGIGIAKALSAFSIGQIPHRLIEGRSSILKGTGVVKSWGATMVDRPYRNCTPRYDALQTFLAEHGSSLNGSAEEIVARSSEQPDAAETLRALATERLREIDYHQWLYLADLVRRFQMFGEEELARAGNRYIEWFQASYRRQTVAELLPLCKKWDSEAYIYSQC